MAVRMPIDGADGFVEGRHMGDFPSDALGEQPVHLGGRQAMDAGEEIVRRIVKKPRTAIAIYATVSRQERAVRLGDYAQAIGRLDLLGRTMMRQYLLVGE